MNTKSRMKNMTNGAVALLFLLHFRPGTKKYGKNKNHRDRFLIRLQYNGYIFC